MITLKFNYLNDVKLECPEKYPDILKIEGPFSIEVNKKLWFFEPDFPICEFMIYLEEWLNNPNKRTSMYYNSIETEDNPLISFISNGEEWFIHSHWQLFDCNIACSRSQLEEAIKIFKNEFYRDGGSI